MVPTQEVGGLEIDRQAPTVLGRGK